MGRRKGFERKLSLLFICCNNWTTVSHVSSLCKWPFWICTVPLQPNWYSLHVTRLLNYSWSGGEPSFRSSSTLYLYAASHNSIGLSTLGRLIVSKTAWLASMMTSLIHSTSEMIWGGGSALIFWCLALVQRSLTEVVGTLLHCRLVTLWGGDGFV